MTLRFTLAYSGLLSASILAAGTSSFAQTGSEAAALGIEEITVTTRLRAESLQDVPLSIAALSSEGLERRGITSIQDLSFQVPGLNFYSLSGGSLGTPIIRGLTKTNTSGFENNVAVFYDGVFLGNNSVLDTGFIDLERVEVAFGPQSALYGRDAFSGAISYIPKNPPNEIEATARATVGSSERWDGFVSLGGPIVEDKLKVLASYGYSEFEGTIENLYDDGAPGGGWDSKHVLQAAIEATPTDWLTARVRYYYSDIDGGNEAKYILAGQPGQNVGGFVNNCGPAAGPNLDLFTAYCGTIFGVDQTATRSEATGLDNEADIVSAFIEANLEAATLTFRYGHSNTRSSGLTDGSLTTNLNSLALPGSQLALGRQQGNRFTQPFTGPVKENSFELRVSSNEGGPLTSLGGLTTRWLFGGFLFDSDRNQDFQIFNENANGLFQSVTLNRNEDIDEWAVFGQLSVDLTDQASLSFEGRYTDSDKTGLNAVQVVLFGINNVTDFGTTTFKHFTPRVTLDYQVNDDVLLYASYARGTKAGGFNTLFFPNDDENAYDEETNITYEAGVKSTWLDGTLVANLAVYYIDWKDLQQRTVSSDPRNAANIIFLNVGSADSYGFEFTGQWQPTEQLNLELGIAHGNPKLGDGTNDPGVAPLGFGTDVSGNSLPSQSTWQFNTAATYTVPEVLPGWDAYGRLGFSYQNGQYSGVTNLAKTESTELMDLRIGLQSDNYEIAFWSQNLLNDKYVITAIDNLTQATETPAFGQWPGTRVNDVYVGNTRTFGVTATVNF